MIQNFITLLITIKNKIRFEFTALLVRLLDPWFPKNSKLWVFPVGAHRIWRDNIKQVYQVAKLQDSITTVILYRRGDKRLPSNCIKYDKDSLKGIFYLLSAGVIFIHHGSRDYYWHLYNKSKRIIVNLWHGIPVKAIRFCELRNYKFNKRNVFQKESKKYTITICSSEIDCLAMSTTFNQPYHHIKLTGLPRNDILLKKEEGLDAQDQEDLRKIKRYFGEKRLVAYVPTWRRDGVGFYQFTSQESDILNNLMDEHNAILGVKIHPNSIKNFKSIQCLNYLDLNKLGVSDIQILLLETCILVTDYSSVWIDYLLLDRPVVSFCYDWKDYIKSPGLIYNYEHIFPGPINKNFNSFIKSLEKALKGKISKEQLFKQKNSKRRFHTYTDAHSSLRVVKEVLKFQSM